MKFPGESDISVNELNAVLNQFSATTEEFHAELSKEVQTDARYDFVPLRSRPLLRTQNGKYVCLDLAFLLEKVHTGVHWLLHDNSSSDKRQSLFQAWGVLFEEYVHYLFQGADIDLPLTYMRAPVFSNGTECFDGLILQGGVFVPMEYKGGFLSREARYSGKSDLCTAEIDKKFAHGCRQLARNIAKVFALNKHSAQTIKEIVPKNYRSVVPVLVVQDNIFRVPFMNWWLNRAFQSEIQKFEITHEVSIRPLSVVVIGELESMINSAEASGFDMVYALHHRAIRDPEMLSLLLEFLVQVPNFGKARSKRTEATFEKLSSSLFKTLFPSTPQSL